MPTAAAPFDRDQQAAGHGAQHGADIQGGSMKVDRIYTRGVVAAARTDTIQQAAQAMRLFHVGSLLVIEKGEAGPEVVGIVTDRDLVLFGLAEGADARQVTVEKLMAPVVASVAEDADVLEALERMRAAGVRRLLVTRAQGEPAGIVSLDDVVDGLAMELASAAAMMKQEVRREATQFAAGARSSAA
jgi:CBS domain-containing protein